MTAVPPLLTPSSHVKPIYVAAVRAATFDRLMGKSGLVKITAPLPAVDSNDVPYMFDALTIA